MQDGAQLAQRAEDLDAQHQHHHERGELHLPALHAIAADRERRRRAQRDAHVADAARERVGAEQPHGGLEEGAPALLQQPRAGLALAEGGQGAQPLDRVQELGAVGGVGLGAGEAVAAVPAVPERRHEEGADRGHQEDEGERQIDRGHHREDQERGERGDEELGEELAEVDLELLHALDDREDDVAGARLGEVGRAQRGDLLVEPPAQPALHARRGVVGDHGAPVLEQAAERDEGRHARDRPRQRASESPASTRPSTQPSRASRAVPASTASRPARVVPAMRRRTPRVKAQSRGFRYTAQDTSSAQAWRDGDAARRPPAPCAGPRARSPPRRPRCTRSRSRTRACSCRCGRRARR